MAMPGKEEACEIENGEDEEEEEEEDFDAGFLELESGDEEEEEEEEEDDDDGEVDDEPALAPEPSESNPQEPSAAAAAEEASGGTDEAECSCSSPREDELMGNALEALPELHSPAHDKYALANQVRNSNNAEEEEAVMDAISKRTRAHYSLTDMTLDQLETFLQESDEDDYFHNVDDEEEYRKFLAAVAQPEDPVPENAIDDEEDDADFELEIQELLESDSEQPRKEEEKPSAPRRPETRELRRERLQNKERLLGVARTPLRPLVPYHVSPPDAPQASQQAGSNMQASGGFFLPQQIGQLHCLIHEHVQLLVQVFALCIMEPSRQQVAIETHRILMELVSRRENSPPGKFFYPEFCFRTPFARASVDDREAGWSPLLATQEMSSVMSVAPLELVRQYLDDVAAAVQDYKQKHVEGESQNARLERQALFPEPERGDPQSSSAGVYAAQSQVKKTLAALLVESTKKQTIASVPKSIAEASARFIPLFNPALFPHKPPPPATANRLLFTDAEDELLAMGLMTFNTDWKAIQSRFLPTKSTHQIFVRQKNRSSSRAPENSIKAVRRMKNSSLTLEERDRIQEALKYFKYDWNKVWQSVVPHRDPALLPRQWRTALGTQKSYKLDELTKGKRRLQVASKRRMKALQKEAELQEQDDLEEVTNGEDEPHIHEAFLSPSSPGNEIPQSRFPAGKAAAARHISSPAAMAMASTSNPTKRPRFQTVKLAPGLPSLNLPAHVRVISQASHSSSPPRRPPAGCYTPRPVRVVSTSSVDTRKVHPLFLEPSFPPGRNPASPRPPGAPPPRAPTFHPFFEVPQSRFHPAVIPSASNRSFHPLLEKPLQSFMGLQKGSSSSGGGGGGGGGGAAAVGDLGGSVVDDAAMESEELIESREEVFFECEEIDDSDKEDSEQQAAAAAAEDKEEEEEQDIEFEEEEIGSESESSGAHRPCRASSLSSSPATSKAPNASSLSAPRGILFSTP